jgi:hypothetical protein
MDFAGSLAAFLMIAFMLHLFINHLGATTFGAGAAFLIDTGYQLVYLSR